MALKKIVTTDFGIDAHYWRIDRLVYLKPEKKIQVFFGLYTNAATSELAKSSLDNMELVFDLEGESLSGDWRVLAYEKAKESIFEGAEDC